VGRAVSLSFASQGAAVVVAGRTARHLDSLVEEIRAQGGRALAVATDISHFEEVERLVAQAVDVFGRIDILVNNAGVGLFAPVMQMNLPDLDMMMDVNLKGTVYCSKAVLPYMIGQGSGEIVNVASVAGIHGIPGQSGYCASKFAVVGFAQALAQEVVAQGIRVSTFCPGGINTPFWDGPTPYPLGEEQREQIMSAESVAEVILSVISLPRNVLTRQVIFFPVNEWH
jgi:3-oxoacyl-[acyl-carrier protein] reductase